MKELSADGRSTPTFRVSLAPLPNSSLSASYDSRTFLLVLSQQFFGLHWLLAREMRRSCLLRKFFVGVNAAFLSFVMKFRSTKVETVQEMGTLLDL